MQVKDLIEILQEMDPEATVRFSYNYGDRGRTMVAPEVESVEEGRVAPNAYVDDYAMVDEFDENEAAEVAVILS